MTDWQNRTHVSRLNKNSMIINRTETELKNSVLTHRLLGTGQVRFPRISVMVRQFLTIPVVSGTVECVLSFVGLTLSDLLKSRYDSTLETIMWVTWGSHNIPLTEVIFTLLTLNFVSISTGSNHLPTE